MKGSLIHGGVSAKVETKRKSRNDKSLAAEVPPGRFRNERLDSKAKVNENNLLGSSSGFRCGTDKTRSRISLERFFVLVSKKFSCDFRAIFVSVTQ